MKTAAKHCSPITQQRLVPMKGQTTTLQMKLQFLTDVIDTIESWTRSEPWHVKF